MFEKLIAFSLRQRVLVLMGTLALLLGGLYAFTRLPIDAVPDVTNNQVQVLTKAPALSPLEVEQFVTFPMELALKAIPDLVELRSVSKPGISVITVVFQEGVDVYFARQLILERLREAEEDLPPGAETPELGPVSTGLGDIFRYTLRDTTGRLSPMDLRTVQDWIVRRQLLGVPGLAEVNSLGGYVKQYHVLVDPERLNAYDLTLREVFEASSRASGTSGGAYIEAGPEQYSVRSVGLVREIEDLANTVVKTTANGTPVFLKDVADVEVGSAIRFGSASAGGEGEVVAGWTMQLAGANARVTVNAVKDRVAEIQAALPEGVVIEPYYDRTMLVGRTIKTVAKNLGEGALLVIVVLLLLLAHLRAGLILASVIPLSMLFAVILMVLTGQSGNLMSLGAIDFGLVVDGSLIIVENILRLLGKHQREGDPITNDEGMRNLVYSGAAEMVKAAKFGVFIIIIVYLPIMALQGIEGKLFRPMALTVSFALLGSLLLSVTYVPVMCSLFLKGKKPIKHSPIIEWLHRRYMPALRRVMGARKVVVGTAVALFAVAVFGFTRLGGEFIPRLDEGDILLQVYRLPSVSLTESQKLTTRVEAAMATFPEVNTVVSNTGRAEISTDPMGPEITDMFMTLHAEDEWASGWTKEELIAAMDERLEEIPGVGWQFLQPIEMRTNELIAGVRGDVAVKVYGENYAVLNPAAEEIARILQGTEGGDDVTMEQTKGLPQLVVEPDRGAIARYGLTVEDVNQLVATAVGGQTAGQVYEGERRFDIVVRYAAGARKDAKSLRALLVPTPGGQRVPLGALADVSLSEGPAQVSRENGSRFITVQANVRGRDVASYVEDVQEQIAERLELPPGYTVDYGGQFENLQEASRRLMIVVPLALGLIFLLLFQAFGSIRLGVIIFLCVPMATIGGVAALYVAGLPFSISAGVGFIALFGIAVLNGIVMVAAFLKFEGEGLPTYEAVLAGAGERLRPVVATATLAALGFVPMMLARSAGAEVQRPLATVVIGGLITSTILTLFVLPIVYAWFGGRRRRWHRPTDAEVALETYTPLSDVDGGGTPVAGEDGATRPSPGLGLAGLALLSLFGAGQVAAQDVGALTLEATRARAAEAAPEIQGGTAGVIQAQALRASAGVLPALEVFYNVDNAPTGSLPNDRETAFGISQNVQFPTYYVAQRRAMGRLVDQAEAEQAAIRREVSLRATLAYVDALAAQEQFALADSAVALARSFAAAATRRRELGESNALEALQASVALANAERRQAEAAGDLVASAAALRSLLALPPEQEVRVAGDLVEAAPLPALAEVEARLLETNPEIAAARRAAEVARAQQAVVASERLPEFGFEVARQTVAGTAGYYGGNVRLGLPLFRLFNRGPDRAAEAATAIAEAQRERVVRAVQVRLHASYAKLTAARAQVATFAERLLPQAERAYDIALQLHALGEASYLEVLAAQTALIETQSSYVEVLRTAARLRAEIEAITGDIAR